MQYVGHAEFSHDAKPKLGVLLTNLGTPDAPTPKALRRYLAQFLWDPRVVELPRPLWWLILNGIILNTRPKRSAEAYASIWDDAAGSPLLSISQQQLAAVGAGLQERLSGPVEVALGMRYGNPSIASGLEQLRKAYVERLVVLPLYPQYSGSTTGSTFDALGQALQGWRWVPEVRFINHYHDEPGYIEALAQSVEAHWAVHGRPERLVMSFHGIPKRYLLAGDPYHCHCRKTGRLVAERLGLAPEDWVVAFQSRFGREEWLKPYTDETLKALPSEGVRHVDVICPGFSADCLETLEEIGVENRDYFLEAGGERYGYIPALNQSPAHIDMLTGLVARHVQGWPEGQVAEAPPEPIARAETQRRAVAMGATQ